MVKTTLVERDFVDGENLLRELDLAHMKVHSASGYMIPKWTIGSEVGRTVPAESSPRPNSLK